MKINRNLFVIFGMAAMTGLALPAHADHCNSDHAKAETASAKADVVDTAIAAGSFNTLVAAVKAAGLVEALKGEGPFTVFAPTDEAFAKLPEGTLDELLKPENKDQLTAILTYHVLSGELMAADVVELKNAKTLQGQKAAIEVNDDGVKIAGATIVKTDIQTSNGVIHVIDSVMLPSMGEEETASR